MFPVVFVQTISFILPPNSMENHANPPAHPIPVNHPNLPAFLAHLARAAQHQPSPTPAQKRRISELAAQEQAIPELSARLQKVYEETIKKRDEQKRLLDQQNQILETKGKDVEQARKDHASALKALSEDRSRLDTISEEASQAIIASARLKFRLAEKKSVSYAEALSCENAIVHQGREAIITSRQSTLFLAEDSATLAFGKLSKCQKEYQEVEKARDKINRDLEKLERKCEEAKKNVTEWGQRSLELQNSIREERAEIGLGSKKPRLVP